LNNQLIHLLNAWYPERDARRWVLGTVYRTRGSAYRKPGAFMLFDDLGQQWGLLSGGCLEADLHRRAMHALDQGRAASVCYDSLDEDDMTFRLGLGCGGIVDIMLQPVTAEADRLGLPPLREALNRREPVTYWQRLPGDDGAVEARVVPGIDQPRTRLVEDAGAGWLVTPLPPLPHLLVIGGGADARPLVAMGAQLGWEITVLDPRPANARPEYFPAASRVSSAHPEAMSAEPWFDSVNAAVVMCHSRSLDAAAIAALRDRPLDYCALLGPRHRSQQVLEDAALTRDALAFHLHGPAGLDLGGELPESVALSILAQCQATLNGRDARPLSEA
jgi:xanthine dehydrogenase accessory factor